MFGDTYWLHLPGAEAINDTVYAGQGVHERGTPESHFFSDEIMPLSERWFALLHMKVYKNLTDQNIWKKIRRCQQRRRGVDKKVYDEISSIVGGQYPTDETRHWKFWNVPFIKRNMWISTHIYVYLRVCIDISNSCFTIQLDFNGYEKCIIIAAFT